MRVSKIIREYVEKRVKEIYGEKSETEKLYDSELAKFNKEIKKANEEIRAFGNKRIEKINNPYNFDVDINSSPFIYEGWQRNSELGRKANTAESERLGKMRNTIENILVDLELGGTRADLEKKLEELAKGVK